MFLSRHVNSMKRRFNFVNIAGGAYQDVTSEVVNQPYTFCRAWAPPKKNLGPVKSLEYLPIRLDVGRDIGVETFQGWNHFPESHLRKVKDSNLSSKPQ